MQFRLLTEHKWWVAAATLWLIVFLVIGGDVVRRPLNHTTTPTYRLASTQWWSGQDPYSYRNHDAFLYFPQAAILYTPFTWGPHLLGDLLERAACFALFAYGLVRLRAFILPEKNGSPGRAFFRLSLLAVPSAFASLRNAQFDLPLGALLLLTTAEIALGRWTAAAFWLCLGLALKPLSVVPMLLFGAIYFVRMAPRLAAGLVLLVAFPFLTAPPGFVAHEYARCAQTLAWAAGANEPRYSDLGALLAHVSIFPPDRVKTVARVICALGFLGLGAVAARRLDHASAAWLIGALSADYLMLFNPRTETCSYVFLGPFLASGALVCLGRANDRVLGWALAAGALGCACDAVPYIHGLTDRWLKPLIALLFLPVLAYLVIKHGRVLFPSSTINTTSIAKT